MGWIILGQKGGKLVLVSDKYEDGSLFSGHYLTVEDNGKKFILRVDDSLEHFPYSPSPLIVDMDLSALSQDQKSINVITASPIIEMPERDDGKSSFIKPQLKARISTQEEIDVAIGNTYGVPIFPASVHGRQCAHLRDVNGSFVKAYIPEDTFFHQMLITGPTGSGKTAAMKYLSQYFVENLKMENGPGAVLAVNVKEEDMLTLDKESKSTNKVIIKEWNDTNVKPHGSEPFRVFYPGNQIPHYSEEVNRKYCEKITLVTQHIDPESLAGLIQNISDIGADQLPGIFRYWQQEVMENDGTMRDFINYFGDPAKKREFKTLSSRNEEMPPVQLFYSTYQNVLNSLVSAGQYFDIIDATELNADDILEKGKVSIIDVTGKGGFGFGAVLLRDLIEKIYQAKSRKENKVPILIIIDEAHEFYGSTRGRDALQILGSVCRKGRSLGIGVIFASQNLQDIPQGLDTVVNTKIHFKPDSATIRSLGVNVAGFDPDSLRIGYAVAKIHELNQVKFVKFPLSACGVNDRKRKD